MAEQTDRFEIQVDTVDDRGTAGEFVQWAKTGHVGPVEQDAFDEFERVVAAMRGTDVGIFARFFTSVTVRRGPHILRRAERHGTEVIEVVAR